jgi:ATP-binding cassette subfamily B protein
LITTSLISIIIYFVITNSVPFYKNIQKKLDKISTVTRENLEGVRVIRAFSNQDEELKRFDNANDDYIKTSIRVSKISALLNPATFLIMNSGIIAILWFGGIRVNIGGITTGKIVALINYMTQILQSIVAVANVIVIFTRAHASRLRIKEVFDTIPSITDKKDEIKTIDDKQKNI